MTTKLITSALLLAIIAFAFGSREYIIVGLAAAALAFLLFNLLGKDKRDNSDEQVREQDAGALIPRQHVLGVD